MTIGEWLKGQGMKNVLEKTPDQWREEFSAAADQLLATRGTVTSDEVVTKVGMPPGNSNAIGATMSHWARQRGLACSYEPSTRPERHAGIVRRWFKGGAA
jgi:hypothetical protein